MQVILLEQIKNLGKAGEVVKVRNGYGRNFLIPYNKALRATKDNIAYYEAQKSEIEKRNKEQAKGAEKSAKKIENSVIAIISQASEDGRLYGSVNARDIVRAIKEKHGEEVERRDVILSQPIKYIGVYTITARLHAEVQVALHINVARSEEEAEINAARFARGEVVMEGQAREQKEEGKAEQKAPESPKIEAASIEIAAGTDEKKAKKSGSKAKKEKSEKAETSEA